MHSKLHPGSQSKTNQVGFSMRVLLHVSSMYRLDAGLKAAEHKHQIERWACDSDVFQDYEKVEQTKQRRKVASDIETCARERWFLLNMKAKFAGTVYKSLSDCV